jgi:hypothetical protein
MLEANADPISSPSRTTPTPVSSHEVSIPTTTGTGEFSQNVDRPNGGAKSDRSAGSAAPRCHVKPDHRQRGDRPSEADMAGRLYAYHNDDRAPWGYSTTLPRPDGSGDESFDRRIACALAILTLGYLLPWAVATVRRRDNAAAIGVINLLTGWTVVGWVVSLAMALRRGSDR